MTHHAHRRHFCLALAALAASGPLRAQSLFTRPIELVVPFAPGGLVDVIGRLSADTLSKELGQSVVVKNVPGAGGNIGYSRLAKAPADGYTLGLVGGGLFINTVIRPSGFDAVKSFRPIGHLGSQAFVLFVNPTRIAATTLADVRSLISKEPERYTYSSGGIGASSHVLMEYLKATQNLQIVHVPYNGQGPAINAVFSGEVDMTLQTVTGAEDLLRTGRLKPLAVTGTTRMKLFPDVPTFGELGVQDIEVVGWSGLVAPAGLPEPQTAKLVDAWNRSISHPELQRALETRSVEVKLMTQQEFARSMQKDKGFWERALAKTGIKAV